MKKGSLFLPTSFRIFYMWLLGFCFLFFSLVADAQAECPVQLNPQRVVVKFGGSVSADCSATVPHKGMGWEANEGSVPRSKVNLTTWRVTSLTEWDVAVSCYILYVMQCSIPLPVTVYKTPDSVSISTVNHTGPMTERNQYELQCDVLNVAPVQYLTVKWYKGQTLVDQNNFNDTIKTPVNKTSKLLIRPDRADDGVQYRCEAELQLGAEGPQPPPTVSSDPLNITVYYEPIINKTKLPDTVHVFRGYPEVIVCEAEGNPKPTIHWHISTSHTVDDETLTIDDSTPEDLSCIAINSVGTTIRHVNVSKHEVFISIVNHTGFLIADETYVLQCDVRTDEKNFVVRWYRRQHLMSKNISTDPFSTSVRKTFELLICPDKADDGVQYRCEAELQQGGEGPHPKVTSQLLNITVFSKPIINETKLLSIVPVFRGYPEVIVCEAEGKPTPTIRWNINTSYIVNNKTLTITDSTPEDLYCIANNSAGTTIRRVKVVLKEDYLPLIAGLVAITVAIISVIFVFIYSIYYKTAKMGRYSLKDAKPCAQNGNIAQNGKNNTIPMKKLSLSNIIA